MASSELYISRKWQQNFDFIAHMCQYSLNTLCVLAPPKTVKTTFMHYCAGHARPWMFLNTLSARADDTCESMRHKVAQAFGLSDQRWDTFEQVRTDEQTESHDEKIWILMIDDAHLLKSEVFWDILQWVRFDVAPARQLHVIWLGEPSLTKLFQSKAVQEKIGHNLYTMDLEPLEHDEVFEWVESCVSQRNAPGLRALSLATLQRQTQLWPGALRAYLHSDKALEHMLPWHQGFSVALQNPWVKAWLWGLMLLAGSMTLAWAVVAPSGLWSLYQQARLQEKQSWQAYYDMIDAPALTSTIAEVSVPVQGDAPAQETHAMAQRLGRSPVDFKPDMRFSRLMGHAAHTYTLQIQAPLSEALVQQGIQEQSFLSHQLDFYSNSFLNGKYMVYVGEFSHREIAEAAQQKLPKAWLTEGVWIRRWQDVQEELRWLGDIQDDTEAGTPQA